MARVATEDDIDHLVAFWRRKNPGLDVDTKLVALRIRRVALLLERALRTELATLEAERWEVEMLVALYRAEEDELTAGSLQRAAQVTSGAITNRLDRLEANGLVTREVAEADRRQVVVGLTPAGLARAEQLIAARNVADQGFFGGVGRGTLRQMNSDLRALMATLDGGDAS